MALVLKGWSWLAAVGLAFTGLAWMPGPSLSEQTAVSPAAQSSPLSNALVLHAKLDYAAALGFLLPLAETGDPVAQEVVGFMYARGEAVPLDRRAAFEWLTRAAENGRTEAQLELAHCYREGLGTPANDGQALFWLERAAAQGAPQAMNAIGEFYLEFATVPVDFRAAMSWFLLAAEHHSWQAMVNLSIQYQLGLGVDSDEIEAFKWVELAAKEGGPFSGALAAKRVLSEHLMPVQVLWGARRARQWLRRHHDQQDSGLPSTVALAKTLDTKTLHTK